MYGTLSGDEIKLDKSSHNIKKILTIFIKVHKSIYQTTTHVRSYNVNYDTYLRRCSITSVFSLNSFSLASCRSSLLRSDTYCGGGGSG